MMTSPFDGRAPAPRPPARADLARTDLARTERLPADRPVDPLFRDWLVPHRDALFRWTMQSAVSTHRRRDFAEISVSIQRLRGHDGFLAWLFGAALQTAHRQVPHGGLPEAALTGLAPELRAVLQRVAAADLRPEEAMALLAQRLARVRRQLDLVPCPAAP